MNGTGYEVHAERLRGESGTLDVIASQCQAIQRTLQSYGLPDNAFGKTHHGPMLRALCDTFEAAVFDRMGTAADSSGQLAVAVRGAATSYAHLEQLTGSAFQGLAGALEGG